jgi:DNA-binding ferritin-like protein
VKQINLSSLKGKGIYFKSINMNRLYGLQDIDFSRLQQISDEKKKKSLLEKQEKIEYKIKHMLNNSKQNIKSIVPIINNVNRQLMQDNLVLKIKIQNMKQAYKNIAKYCKNLQDQMQESDDEQVKYILDDIFEKFKSEMKKVKED